MGCKQCYPICPFATGRSLTLLVKRPITPNLYHWFWYAIPYTVPSYIPFKRGPSQNGFVVPQTVDKIQSKQVPQIMYV